MSRGTNSDWRSHYEGRMLTPEDAAGKVTSGSRIYAVTAHESPKLMAALLGRSEDLEDVEIRSMGGLWASYGLEARGFATRLRANMSFATPVTRDAIDDGTIDFTVVGYGDVHRHIDQERAGSRPYDFSWFTLTPPNEAGFCCAGGELWDLRTSMKRATTTVAAINEHLPRTHGDTWFHVSEIDWFVEDHEPKADRSDPVPTPAARAIADHVATLVRDGDTLQIGSGTTSGALALLGAFADKEDLGYFSELSVPGLFDLVRRGNVTSKYATVHPNKFVVTGLTGGRSEYEFVDDNPFVEFYDYDYMLNPAVIGQNDNMVAINNALSVDLRGQIAVSSIGPRLVAGTGGQQAYHLGAYLSRGGRAITVLPATTTDGATSRIVAEFSAGQIVTVPWDFADTIVTEFGVAELVGKTMRQRADALIEIAHPDFRIELRRAAGALL